MHKHFQEYFWKNGIPQGRKKLSDEQAMHMRSYKIISDPYWKRISLERYENGLFHSILYDSLLLDFRKLNPAEQTRWDKAIIEESVNKTIEVIRNEDDRSILIETCLFVNGRCRECQISSIHGIRLSTHRLLYMDDGDSLNGAILYDKQNNPVMQKTYAIDPQYRDFTTLLNENWDMQPSAFQSSWE